ncbi:MAG: PEGA domain-containing protein [Blastocatellia bacterium]
MKPLPISLVLSVLGLSLLAACTASQPESGAARTSNAAAANTNAQSSAGSAVSPSRNSNEPPASKMAQTGTGSIEVTSTPAGARVLLVSIDEGGAGEPQPRGVTPTTITGVYPGKYTVDLEKPGYRFFQKDVVVKESVTVKVKATLRKQ